MNKWRQLGWKKNPKTGKVEILLLFLKEKRFPISLPSPLNKVANKQLNILWKQLALPILSTLIGNLKKKPLTTQITEITSFLKFCMKIKN